MIQLGVKVTAEDYAFHADNCVEKIMCVNECGKDVECDKDNCAHKKVLNADAKCFQLTLTRYGQPRQETASRDGKPIRKQGTKVTKILSIAGV